MSESSDQQNDGSDNHEDTNLWEIDKFDEIASSTSWDSVSTKELQHIIATHSALLAIYDTYRKVYNTTFDNIHKDLVTPTGEIKKSVAISKNIYHSLPNPLEELRKLTKKAIDNMRDSGRFPQFDFHHLDGNLQITPPLGDIDEMDIEFLQSRTQIQESKQQQFTNFQADDEQTAQSRDFLSRTFALKETITNQKESEIHPLYERKASPTIPMNQGQSHPSSQAAMFSTPLFGAGTPASSLFDGQFLQQPSNTINSSSSSYQTGGGIFTQRIAHKAPAIMHTFSIEELKRFRDQTESLHASQQLCSVHVWLPPTNLARATMFWEFTALNLVSDIEDFNNMLQDTDRFLLVSKQFLQQHRAVRGTSSSPIDIIKSKLKFNFNNPTKDEQRAAMNKQWAEFSNDHPDLANPNPGADH